MNEKEKFDLRKLQSEDEVRVHTPFSPTILEFKVPQKFLDIVMR